MMPWHDLQMICVGAMLVLTPSMLVLALLLCRVPVLREDEEMPYHD